jgi:hypothetical protein
MSKERAEPRTLLGDRSQTPTDRVSPCWPAREMTILSGAARSIGEGLLAQVTSLRTAGLIFAGMVAALSAAALALVAARSGVPRLR